MTDSGPSSRPVFADDDSPTASFFRERGKRNDDLSFAARNFLLDEGVVDPRAKSYHRRAGTGFGNDGDWQTRHGRYLPATVGLEQKRGIQKTLNPKRPSRCPQTFRFDEAFRAAGSAYKKLRLLHVVAADFIASILGTVTTSELVSSCREVLEARQAKRRPDPHALDTVTSALTLWPLECQLRPVWATFLEDHDDLFTADPSGDAPSWANELRNRLGLSHLDPVGGKTPIIVFVYPVSAVPKRSGLEGATLATPTVLDGKLSPAFCPAPLDHKEGRVVHLAASDRAPSREVLHPFFAPKLDHLFRVGDITERVPELGAARRRHLQHLRESRPGYADATDADLLGAAP